MKRRGKKQEESGSWMDTYGDMVTLLLCFFVLLYSISSVDQTKWKNLVKSMNPEAAEAVQDKADKVADSPKASESDSDVKFEELYNSLVQIQNSAGESMDIQIARGDGYQFITFRDRVFFDGDSFVLKEEGKKVLDSFSAAIAPAAESVKEIQVLGHTTQADPAIQNELVSDRLLSSDRAAVVVAYIQGKNVIDPKKLVSAGYGQFRPIDTFETEEGRRQNRRVEILITQSGAVEQSLDEYYKQVYQDGEQK
ncbi:OmpA/MotB family protein [Clostridium sp. C105KSO13]|uniref:OmpA/MotB family protein n=1 Tax=Clostridium sp. C105KSO13 TaxID=1776045 RepID=UPI000740646F|nr:flagellar motor protein MotB [Clostridium sp. C105KSO13]CUX49293.1 Photosystem I P700 chlorophyll a apoprotein A2 [Clostridium sp. C105KSO13]